MPDHVFEPPPSEPLFPEDDPLTITIPKAKGAEEGTPEFGGTFLCLDRANPPLEDDVNPNDTPVAYVIELMALQIVEEQRAEFEAALVSAVRDVRITIPALFETARWIGEQRAEAEKKTTARVVDRPTGARRRSGR